MRIAWIDGDGIARVEIYLRLNPVLLGFGWPASPCGCSAFALYLLVVDLYVTTHACLEDRGPKPGNFDPRP